MATFMIVECLGDAPTISGSSILPLRVTHRPKNLCSDVGDGFNRLTGRLIWSYDARLRMFTKLPLSTSTRYTLWLAILIITTRALSWRYYIPCISTSVNSSKSSMRHSAWCTITIDCLCCQSSSNFLASFTCLLHALCKVPQLSIWSFSQAQDHPLHEVQVVKCCWGTHYIGLA